MHRVTHTGQLKIKIILFPKKYFLICGKGRLKYTTAGNQECFNKMNKFCRVVFDVSPFEDNSVC